MTSINISLSESMKVFIEEQVAKGGYSSASEYLQQLILQDQQSKSQEHSEELIIEGLDSGEPLEVRDEWWEKKGDRLMVNLPTQNQLSDEEFETVADQLADEFASHFGSNIPVLSDYAVSREGIYEDHP